MNITPRNTTLNIAHRGLGDSVNAPDSGLTHSRLALKQRFNLTDILLRNLDATVSFASLCNHVLHVVLLSSNKQVVGIDTGGVVAVMERHHSFWDINSYKKKRDTMCSVFPDKFIANKTAIASRIDSALPLPTLRRTFYGNFAPETSIYKRVADFFRVHKNSLSLPIVPSSLIGRAI